MTETIDTTKFRALAEAADAQPYNIHAVAEYRQFLVFTLSPRPDKVVALLDRLAAAEARNATLTDDAARLDYLIDGEGSRCWVLPVLQGDPSKEGYCLQWMDCHDRITWQEGFFATAREAIDAAIQARAAASISTKGDGHGL